MVISAREACEFGGARSIEQLRSTGKAFYATLPLELVRIFNGLEPIPEPEAPLPPMTYAERVAYLQRQIVELDYYPGYWYAVCGRHDMSFQGIADAIYEPRQLNALVHGFTQTLPTSPAIEREPYELVVELAAEIGRAHV